MATQTVKWKIYTASNWCLLLAEALSSKPLRYASVGGRIGLGLHPKPVRGEPSSQQVGLDRSWCQAHPPSVASSLAAHESCPDTVGWAPTSRHHYWGSSSSSLTHLLTQGNPDWLGWRKELGMKCRCEGDNQRKGMEWLKPTLFEDIRMGSPLSQSFSRAPKGDNWANANFFTSWSEVLDQLWRSSQFC